MSDLALLALTGLLVFAVWTALGYARSRRPLLLTRSVWALTLPALLVAWTWAEMPLWAHLPFPFSLLGWALLPLLSIPLGAALLARRRFTLGWPVLGLGVSTLLSVSLALLLNHFTSGDPII